MLKATGRPWGRAPDSSMLASEGADTAAPGGWPACQQLVSGSRAPDSEAVTGQDDSELRIRQRAARPNIALVIDHIKQRQNGNEEHHNKRGETH